MSLAQRPSMKAVPIDRSGPPACRTTLHRHLTCFRCQVTSEQDPTVYQRIALDGTRQPPLCTTCAVKLDRMSRLSRRGECAE